MKKEQTFEASMKKLETIVKKLETGEQSLEKSLELFEEGTHLASYCYKILENAEKTVAELSEPQLASADKLGEGHE